MRIVCSEHCFQVSAAEVLSSRGFPTFEVSFDCTMNGLSKVHCKWFNLMITSNISYFYLFIYYLFIIYLSIYFALPC